MKINVADHALMRFIELVGGVDLSSFRAHIAEIVRDSMSIGATKVTMDGFIYVIDPKTRTVITVLDESEYRINPNSNPRKRLDRDAIQAKLRRG
jgi:hypothetical protein